MGRQERRAAAAMGLALVVLYTLVMAAADGVTKQVAQGFAAPQLFCVSGLLVALLTWITARVAPGLTGPAVLIPACRGGLILRSALTLLATVLFFYALRALPLAEVFLFVGLMPVLGAVLSGPLLGEAPAPGAWLALGLGCLGVLFLFPEGLHQVRPAHGVALLGCLAGTLSLILLRRMMRAGSTTFAQVFFPNLAMGLGMAAVLPWVWRPMGWGDAALVLGYSALLFGGRWLMVLVMQRLRAYVALPLVNMQFIWAVVIGYVAFGDVPGWGTLVGAALVITGGVMLVLDQARAQAGPVPPGLPESAAEVEAGAGAPTLAPAE